jgi:hypothetical protein
VNREARQLAVNRVVPVELDARFGGPCHEVGGSRFVSVTWFGLCQTDRMRTVIGVLLVVSGVWLAVLAALVTILLAHPGALIVVVLSPVVALGGLRLLLVRSSDRVDLLSSPT